MTADNGIERTDEVTLLEYWRIVQKRRKMILAIFLASVISAAVISLLMTPIFQARATLIPIESSQGKFSAALGALQSIPFVAGAVGGALGKGATDKLVNILNSRTVAEDVIRRLNLIQVIFSGDWDPGKKEWKTDKPPTLQDALHVLQKEIVKIADDRKALVSVTVEFENPKLAADVANEYVEALQRFLNVNAISLAKRNRMFLEKQLASAKVELGRIEEELKSYQTSQKIAVMDVQAEVAVRALAELKAQIIAREIQLGAMREFATKENPDVKRVEDEIREIRVQLARLESGEKKRGTQNDSLGAMITLSEAPRVGLGYLRLKRDVLIQGKVFELLTQQYELAKVEEAKDDITFQVVDQAIAPEKRIKPQRVLMTAVAGVVSLLLGVFIVFCVEYVENRAKKPAESLSP